MDDPKIQGQQIPVRFDPGMPGTPLKVATPT